MGKQIDVIPAASMKALQDYAWPGNVRELENVLERAVVNSRGPILQLVDNLAVNDPETLAPSRTKSLEEMERDHIIKVLDETNWRVNGSQGAATLLNMNPSTLRSRMRKLGIKKHYLKRSL